MCMMIEWMELEYKMSCPSIGHQVTAAASPNMRSAQTHIEIDSLCQSPKTRVVDPAIFSYPGNVFIICMYYMQQCVHFKEWTGLDT